MSDVAEGGYGMNHEALPKPCRILKRLGRCDRETICEYPLGLRGCFTAYERESDSGGPPLVEMLDMTTDLHEETNELGKKVQVFGRRVW